MERIKIQSWYMRSSVNRLQSEGRKIWLLKDVPLVGSGPNDNYYWFEPEELEKSYKTLEGVPVVTNLTNEPDDHATKSSLNTVGHVYNVRWEPDEEFEYNGQKFKGVVYGDLEITNPEVGVKMERTDTKGVPEIDGVSIGATADGYCSICGKLLSECEHELGKEYEGKICYLVPRNIEFDHVALTSYPAWKKARIKDVVIINAMKRGDLMKEKIKSQDVPASEEEKVPEEGKLPEEPVKEEDKFKELIDLLNNLALKIEKISEKIDNLTPEKKEEEKEEVKPEEQPEEQKKEEEKPVQGRVKILKAKLKAKRTFGRRLNAKKKNGVKILSVKIKKGKKESSNISSEKRSNTSAEDKDYVSMLKRRLKNVYGIEARTNNPKELETMLKTAREVVKARMLREGNKEKVNSEKDLPMYVGKENVEMEKEKLNKINRDELRAAIRSGKLASYLKNVIENK